MPDICYVRLCFVVLLLLSSASAFPRIRKPKVPKSPFSTRLDVNPGDKVKAGPTVHQEAVRLFVRGEVIGVGFREYVQNLATNLRLVGLVRHLSDGTTEVYAQGLVEDVKSFVTDLNTVSERLPECKPSNILGKFVWPEPGHLYFKVVEEPDE